MGQTLTNGIYLPAEGERNCYTGLAANWTALDSLIGGYNAHIGNATIHVTAEDKAAWNGKADASALTAHTGDTTIHVTAEDKQAWNGKADASALTAHTGDTTIHVTAEDKAAWNGKANDADVVHKSGNETISGQKTFANNTMVVGRSTDTSSAIQIVNADVVGDSANGASSFEVYGSSVSDANKIGSITIGEFSNNGGSYATIECNRTVSGVKSSNVIRSLIRPSGSKELSATVDNACKLGTEFLRWSKIYGTEYYYGSNNVEFSTKFVTTDTNQTITGSKTFSSNALIYNSDATATTPNLYLRSSKIEISSQGNTSGDQNLIYLDKNNTAYAYIKGAIQSNGSVVKIRSFAKDSSDNSVINELQILANINGRKVIFPAYTNEVELGDSTYKWKSFNGLEPSSLSLPSDNANAMVDISSYLSNLDGTNNTYVAPANGWISITMSNSTGIQAYINGLWGHQIVRPTVGVVRFFMPVLKNKTINILIFGGAIDNARFIPCQGNV